jgi:hypothetical protein
VLVLKVMRRAELVVSMKWDLYEVLYVLEFIHLRRIHKIHKSSSGKCYVLLTVHIDIIV